VIDTAGDGILAEFPSVIGAIECAVGIQSVMARRNQHVPEHRQMRFRIGINLGDVIHDTTRIYGDGINVAARLESLPEAGGVLVSQAVHDQVRDRLRLEFDDLGERELKNIARRVRVYRRRRRLDAPPRLPARPLPLFLSNPVRPPPCRFPTSRRSPCSPSRTWAAIPSSPRPAVLIVIAGLVGAAHSSIYNKLDNADTSQSSSRRCTSRCRRTPSSFRSGGCERGP
jgi:adenylate/guanylate cyclase family protein